MGRSKPSIYLDTNVISVLTYSGRDPMVVAQQATTEDWWALECPSFDVWSSRIVLEELSGGVYPGQDKAIQVCVRLRHLPFTSAVKRAATLLKLARIVPEGEDGDAIHLAFTIVHGIDYLMSWNHAHLVNVDTQNRLQRLCKHENWRIPVLVSPNTIPKATLGQEIEREDEEEI